MLNDTLYRIRRIDGLQQLQRRGEGGARELTSSRLRLSAGASYKYQIAGEETVLVLQEGRGTFATPDELVDPVADQRVRRAGERDLPAARRSR